MKVMRGFLAGLALAIPGLAGMPSIASAQMSPPDLPDIPQIGTRVDLRYYDVTGRTARDLEQSLATTGPPAFEAVTDYYIEPSYVFQHTESGCELSSLDVLVDIVITYPRWLDHDRAPRRLRRHWEIRMARLEIHENGHAVLAFMGAVDVYNAMIIHSTAPTCEILQTRLDASFEEAFSQVRSEQLRYDRITQHGLIQEEFDWAPVFGG